MPQKNMNEPEDLTGWHLCICPLGTDNLDVVWHLVKVSAEKDRRTDKGATWCNAIVRCSMLQPSTGS